MMASSSAVLWKSILEWRGWDERRSVGGCLRSTMTVDAREMGK